MSSSWEDQHQRKFEKFRRVCERDLSSASSELSTECVKRFRELIRHHQKSHSRSFPWRKNRTAYRVLVSEIMLQQTQAGRVVEKYRAFLKAFPSLRALAEASPADVLRAWQGLGYNRRGLALQRAAVKIRAEHGGRVPRQRDALEALPGVGSYTAAAIRTFAFDEREMVIETNIRTVFIHCFFPEGDSVQDSVLEPLIERTSVCKDAAAWYDALMDYGAMLKASGKCANHRNPSYRAQSKFKGSKRELRGRVVRELSKEAFLSSKRLNTLCGNDARYLEVLRGLLDEGLVEKKGQRIMLSGARG